jgi:hypothetical protein
MGQKTILHAYRHLLRQSLRAVQFSKPARYVIRDRLRSNFRRGDATDFNAKKVENTLEFLKYATLQNGMEHKILKNLVQVWWYRDKHPVRVPKTPTIQEAEALVTAFDTFIHNIQMLNESMGMCIPTRDIGVIT